MKKKKLFPATARSIKPFGYFIGPAKQNEEEQYKIKHTKHTWCAERLPSHSHTDDRQVAFCCRFDKWIQILFFTLVINAMWDKQSAPDERQTVRLKPQKGSRFAIFNTNSVCLLLLMLLMFVFWHSVHLLVAVLIFVVWLCEMRIVHTPNDLSLYLRPFIPFIPLYKMNKIIRLFNGLS